MLLDDDGDCPQLGRSVVLETQPSYSLYPSETSFLLDIGFPAQNVSEVLIACNGNLENAVSQLTTSSFSSMDSHQILADMGFDSSSINRALEMSQGDVNLATSFLVGETNVTSDTSTGDDSSTRLKHRISASCTSSKPLFFSWSDVISLVWGANSSSASADNSRPESAGHIPSINMGSEKCGGIMTVDEFMMANDNLDEVGVELNIFHQGGCHCSDDHCDMMTTDDGMTDSPCDSPSSTVIKSPATTTSTSTTSSSDAASSSSMKGFSEDKKSLSNSFSTDFTSYNTPQGSVSAKEKIFIDQIVKQKISSTSSFSEYCPLVDREDEKRGGGGGEVALAWSDVYGCDESMDPSIAYTLQTSNLSPVDEKGCESDVEDGGEDDRDVFQFMERTVFFDRCIDKTVNSIGAAAAGGGSDCGGSAGTGTVTDSVSVHRYDRPTQDNFSSNPLAGQHDLIARRLSFRLPSRESSVPQQLFECDGEFTYPGMSYAVSTAIDRSDSQHSLVRDGREVCDDSGSDGGDGRRSARKESVVAYPSATSALFDRIDGADGSSSNGGGDGGGDGSGIEFRNEYSLSFSNPLAGQHAVISRKLSFRHPSPQLIHADHADLDTSQSLDQRGVSVDFFYPGMCVGGSGGGGGGGGGGGEVEEVFSRHYVDPNDNQRLRRHSFSMKRSSSFSSLRRKSNIGTLDLKKVVAAEY